MNDTNQNEITFNNLAPDYQQQINEDIGNILSKTRDVSPRDGIQSEDANLWEIKDILEITKELDEFARVVKEHSSSELPPVEAWGGGQVLQPAQFLAEDPVENLEKINETSPNLDLQALYRGQQAYGFTPVADDVQEAAINLSADKGIDVIRIFDMMNDKDNLATGIEAGLEKRQQQIESGTTLEDALTMEVVVTYASDPQKGERAWTFEEYGDLLVETIKSATEDKNLSTEDVSNAIEAGVKDYAGQLVSEDKTRELMSTLRTRLDEAGLEDVKLNLHSHGQKTDLLMAALDEGADRVDVAIGDLSGGNSHTNMRDMINAMMEEKGYNKEEYKDSPIMQKLAEVEEAISIAAEKHKPLRMKDVVSEEQVLDSKLAKGAVSAVWEGLEGKMDAYSAVLWKDIPEEQKPSKEQLFERILEIATEEWEKGGQFNTVTPGALILANRATAVAAYEVADKEIPLSEPNSQAYKDVVMGRYGTNQGMDKGLGDQEKLETFLLEDAIKTLDKNTESREGAANEVLQKVGLEGINLNKNDAEERLKSTNIDDFKKAISESSLDEDTKNKVLASAESGKFTTPATTLEDGKAALEAFEEKNGIKVPDEQRDESILKMALFKNGSGSFQVAEVLETKTATGELPPQNSVKPKRTKHIDNLIGDDVEKLAEVSAKKQILTERYASPESKALGSKVAQYRQEGIDKLATKKENIKNNIEAKLDEAGFEKNARFSSRERTDADEFIEKKLKEKTPEKYDDLKETPENFWKKTETGLSR